MSNYDDTMQAVHDMTVDSGARCFPPQAVGKDEHFTDQQARHLQKLHDLSVEGGADCEKAKGKTSAALGSAIDRIAKMLHVSAGDVDKAVEQEVLKRCLDRVHLPDEFARVGLRHERR